MFLTIGFTALAKVLCPASVASSEFARANENSLMMTPTHMLVAAGVTTRRDFKRWQIALAYFAGFFPDAAVFAMVVWARATGFDGNLWRQPDGLYWVDPWQIMTTITNSFPLWLLVLGLGYWLWRRGNHRDWAIALMVLGGGCLLHAALDFPVHTSDAHVHFWPFSDWRFISGVSYYQPQHYGSIVSKIEIVIGAAMVVLIFRRFKGLWVRGFTLLLCLPYLLELIPREWTFRVFQFLF